MRLVTTSKTQRSAELQIQNGSCATLQIRGGMGSVKLRAQSATRAWHLAPPRPRQAVTRHAPIPSPLAIAKMLTLCGTCAKEQTLGGKGSAKRSAILAAEVFHLVVCVRHFNRVISNMVPRTNSGKR